VDRDDDNVYGDSNGLRHRIAPTSGRIVTQIQSDSSPTDSPVRILHAQPRSRLKHEVPGHADGQKVLFAVKSMGGESNASLPLRQFTMMCPLGSGGCLCRLQPALRATRKGGPIIEAACWAHGRRKFFDLARLQKAPIAIEAVERIDALFAIEHEINGLAPEQRLRCAASAAGHLSSSWRPGCASNMPSSPGGGAGGNIAIETVVNAPADGYTLLYGSYRSSDQRDALR
jgi:hypothetical protein